MRVLVLLIVLGVAMIGLTFLLDDVETTARLDKGSSAAPVFEPESEPVKKTEKPKEPEKPPTNIGAQVKDTKGNAIEGVRVVLYPFKSGLKAAPLDGAVETDAEGRFTIDLPGAGAQVVFRHREYIFFKLHLPGGTEKINDVSLAKGAPLRVTVFDPDRKPLARALVSARWVLERGVAGMWSWDHDQELDTVPTGPDGRAHLAAVMPGNVRIRIDHPRYAPAQLEIVVERLDEPVEKEVVLSWGGTITGRVLAPDRTPVEGAKVTRRRVYETARYALTDDEGHYELTGVAAGEVRVVATAETYGPGYFGSEIGWGEPVPVSLKQGETVAGIDIVLSQAAYVRGRVVDAQGAPVPGVAVRRGWWEGDAGTPTDEDGRFVLGPLESGGFWLNFQSLDYLVNQVHKSLKAGQDLDLGDLVATKLGIVRGTLVGPDDKPVPKAFVWSSKGGHSEMKEDGSFEIKSLRPGEFVLKAGMGGKGSLAAVSETMSIKAGEVIEGVTLRMEKRYTISGRVVTDKGAPRTHGRVAAVPAEKLGPIRRGTYNAVWISNEGAFSISGLKPGEYRVGIIDQARSNNEDGVVFVAGQGSATVQAGATDLDLIHAVSGVLVRGRVVARRGGQPIEQFSVSFIEFKKLIPVYVDLPNFDTTNKKDGIFEHEIEDPGNWAVEVSAPGYASFRTQPADYEAGKTYDLGVIRLGDGGTIMGTVRDHAGQPVPYTRINILSPKMETNEDQPFTDREGRYRVDKIAPGIYTVFAVSPRHPLGIVRNIKVADGEETKVNVQFLEASPLTLLVRDVNGQPIEGAELRYTFDAVRPLTSNMFRSYLPPGYGGHKTDAEGMLFKPALPPGRVSLTIVAEGFVTRTLTANLKPGQSNRTEVRLKREAD